MSALAQQARDFDWGQVVLLVLFVVFPLVARLMKWLGDKVKGAAAPGAGLDGEDALERRRRLREERRRAEAEGEDLWRRLARGEAPPTAAPVFPAPPARRSYEGDDVRELSLEDQFEDEFEDEVQGEPEAAEARPLATMGEVQEHSVPPEVSREHAREPSPLTAMGSRSVRAGISAVPSEAPALAPRTMRFDLTRDELRHAIVLSELLGPPVSERPLRA